MCRPTTTTTTTTTTCSSNSECSVTASNAPKRRRLNPSVPHRRQVKVRFAPQVSLYEVPPLCNDYNHRIFFYSKNELDRLLQMEIRRNQVSPPSVIDQPDSDLTWRGLEPFRDGGSLQRATVQSHVQMILQEASDSWDEDELRFLSETLSKEQVIAARTRGKQDEAVALGKEEVTTISSTTTLTTASRRNHYRWLTRSGPSLQEQLLWLIRVVGFFVFCGLFLSSSHGTH
jgi:hypothetical protein